MLIGREGVLFVLDEAASFWTRHCSREGSSGLYNTDKLCAVVGVRFVPGLSLYSVLIFISFFYTIPAVDFS